jgi:hypothetical protein
MKFTMADLFNSDPDEEYNGSKPSGGFSGARAEMLSKRLEYQLREPHCGQMRGFQDRANPQKILCWECGSYCFFAKKVEIGEKPLTVSTARSSGFKPAFRFRVIERQHGRCWLCGADGPFHMSHLLSIDDGIKVGASPLELVDEANIVALCEECNLGMGRVSATISTYTHRLMAELLQAEIKRRQQGA